MEPPPLYLSPYSLYPTCKVQESADIIMTGKLCPHSVHTHQERGETYKRVCAWDSYQHNTLQLHAVQYSQLTVRQNLQQKERDDGPGGYGTHPWSQQWNRGQRIWTWSLGHSWLCATFAKVIFTKQTEHVTRVNKHTCLVHIGNFLLFLFICVSKHCINKVYFQYKS